MQKPDRVNGSDSQADESLDEKDPSHEGESASDANDRPNENLKREIERKVAKRTAELEKRLTVYETQLNELKGAKEERLDELENKPKLTLSEREEMIQLEAAINKIEHEKEAKPWLEANRRQSEKVADEKLAKRDFDDAMDLVEELADKEGVDRKKFEDELLPYLKNYRGEERYIRKVKLAYKDLLKRREDAKELKELREAKNGNGDVRRETSQPSRPQSKKDLLNGAFKEGNFRDLLRGIEAVQHDDRRTRSQ